MKIKEIILFLESKYPKDLASDFDQERIGLILGSENLKVENILLSLDLNLDVLNEAVENKANFIILHHNPFFHPIRIINFDSYESSLLQLLFKHRISIYVMHTNLDVGHNGVNDTLASMLSIRYKKTIPTKDEFIRYGEIKKQSLSDLIDKVKEEFGLNHLRYVGNLDREISRVGIVGGSGGREEDITLALSLGLDCYITGEIKLSASQQAYYYNLCLIEVNHGIEKFVMNSLKEILVKEFDESLKVMISIHNTDPLESI